MAQAEPREAKAVSPQKEPIDSPERMHMTRLQIFLDRANFRPGKIDGLGGEFTQKALDRYNQVNDKPQGAMPDLGEASPYREYTITDDDAKWVGPQASSPAAQEKLKGLLYSDFWELVAERFHCDKGFLQELNPGAGEPKVGATLKVPDAPEFIMAEVVALEKKRIADKKAKDAKAKEIAASTPPAEGGTPAPAPTATPNPSPTPIPRHIVLSREQRLIEVFEGDKLLACFPCTPGSKGTPVPPGTWKVTANILMPYYRWDKSVLDSGVRSENAFNLPPGPNNPVGIVWMALNRPSVGMHGTTSPDQIGRNESHGCIRLANWDAFLLSQMIEKGVAVQVQ